MTKAKQMVTFIAAGLLLIPNCASAAADDFYAGKTIRVAVRIFRRRGL